MKPFIISKYSTFKTGLMLLCLLGVLNTGFGQNDSTATEAQTEAPKKVSKPVKATFESIWILDDQTVEAPIKGTFELDFMHRWGTWDAGYQGLYGLFTDINMRF